jgi:hypothetical protein
LLSLRQDTSIEGLKQAMEKMVKATDRKKDRYGSEDIFYQQGLKIQGRT